MILRKLTAAAAALCITFPSAASALTGFAANPLDSNDIVAGDVNGDYVFNLSDIVLFQHWLRGDGGLFSDKNMPRAGADVNKDGKYDVFDLVGMRKLIVSAIEQAPVPSYAPTAQNLCAGVQSSPVKAVGVENDEFINSQLNFTLELFKSTYNENPGKNDLISPYSIMQALGMTANGADGKTLEEMENVLGGGIPIDSLNEYLLAQRQSTVHDGNYPYWTFNTANSIWARDDQRRIQARPEFIQKCVDYYDSEFYLAPFDDSTLSDVNNWVNEKTNKMIPTILQRIDEYDVMYLVNAIAFEAEWAEKYEDYAIEDGKFTAADGTVQQAKMLCSTEKYVRDDNSRGMIKYYSGGNYGFAALLPDADTSLDEYIQELTPKKLTTLLSDSTGNKHTTARVKLPKFKYEYENELSDELITMGMPTAFSSKADFTRMNSADNDIFIGQVIHKTFIDLDENGTKAAAATVVATKNTAMPLQPEIELVFDRPFIFCIFDTNTNIPVFIGVLNSLE